MMGRSHRIIGAAAGITCVTIFSPLSAIWIYPVAALLGSIGSLLPDIDHRKSTAGAALGPLSWIISSFFAHRGMTHSALIVASMSFAAYIYFPNIFLYSAIAGYASHIIGDMLTKSGVMIAWPLNIRVGIPLITTNSKKEPFVAVSLSIIIVSLPYYKEIINFTTASTIPFLRNFIILT